MSDRYAYAVRKKLKALERIARDARLKAARSSFYEIADAALAAENNLRDHEAMYASLCAACGAPHGEHGRDLACLCGCPPETHTKIREQRPKIQRVTVLEEDGRQYPQTRGEPPFEREFCSRCRTGRWEDQPEPGVCKGYETAAGAEACQAIQMTSKVVDSRVWSKEIQFRLPFPEEVASFGLRIERRETKALKASKKRRHTAIFGA